MHMFYGDHVVLLYGCLFEMGEICHVIPLPIIICQWFCNTFRPKCKLCEGSRKLYIFDFSVSFTMPRKPENVGIALLQCGAPKAWVLRFTDFFANFLDRINTQHPWFPMHFHGCVRAVVCPMRLMPNVEWAHRPEQSSFSKIIHFEYAYAIARFWQ